MANLNNRLKAWVRIDGLGNVVPGGPIVQAKKPAVGRWREINLNLCCNYTTTTTTSSSSTSTSTTTTTTTRAPVTTTTTTTIPG